MIIYRIYTIDPDGHVANIEVAECADDKEVVEKVLAQANGRRRHQLVRPSLCRRRPLVLQSLVHHGSWRARRSVDGKLCREKLWRAARGWLSHTALPTFAVTPYGAVQFQDFNTPAYSESDVTGGALGLNFNAMNTTDVRTELGSRFDAPTLLYGKLLVPYGRVAWAHDFVSNPALSAAFESLPGASFTVLGAPMPHDSAVTTAGAQLYLMPR